MQKGSDKPSLSLAPHISPPHNRTQGVGEQPFENGEGGGGLEEGEKAVRGEEAS